MGCFLSDESEDEDGPCCSGVFSHKGIGGMFRNSFLDIPTNLQKKSAAAVEGYKKLVPFLTKCNHKVDEAVIKGIGAHFTRAIATYLENPQDFYYVKGKLSNLTSGTFQDKRITEEKNPSNLSTKYLEEQGIAYACKKGWKLCPNQDDFFILIDGHTRIFGIFDGHGSCGHRCANIVQQLFPKLLLSNPQYKKDPEKALKETFANVDEALRGIAQMNEEFSVLMSGTTATVTLIRDGQLYVAHVGDSRAVLAKQEGGKLVCEPLTRDHRPFLEGEKARIETMGGEVKSTSDGSPLRLFAKNESFPGLAMSRAIGDEIGKSIGLSGEPEIKSVKIDPSHSFVAIGSDGLWEFMQNEDIIGTIAKEGKKNVGKSALKLSHRAHKAWLDREKDLADDITCIIYYLT